jgi:uncharacterized DUF497 family protein
VATVVHGDFEWDEEKAAANRVKHGVTFEEALLALKDALSTERAYSVCGFDGSRRTSPNHQRARRDFQ